MSNRAAKRTRTVTTLLALTLATTGLGVSATVAQAASSYTVAGHLEGLSLPYGMAVDQSSGDVYVADTGAQQVDKFEGSTAGGELLHFDGSGTPQGDESFSPTGVAVSASGQDVWVLDRGNSVVDEFDSSGVYSGTQITGSQTPQGAEWAPEGVAISPVNGDVYVVDGAHGVVDVFSASGTYERQFGELGSGAGQFEQSYTDPAVDSEGNVYVRDYHEGDGRVEKFNAAGQFVSVLDSDDAQTVAVNPSTNEVYVADTNENKLAEVNVYSSAGVLQTSFGSSAFASVGIYESYGLTVNSSTGQVYVGNADDEAETADVLIFAQAASSYTVAGHLEGLSLPYGMAVDQSSGDVYVADTGAQQVDKFEGSTAGGELLHFDGSGTPQGDESFSPTGVAVSASGQDVWVLDRGNSVVDEFDSSGVYSGTQITGSQTPQGAEWAPEGVAISPVNGDVYVVDGAHGVVDVFSASGTYERQFGELGSGAGQFEQSYTDPAVDSEGNVYVRDYHEGDGRVEKFNAAGQFVSVLDSDDAQTVAVNPSTNEVYVADTNENKLAEVNVYSSAGVLQTSFGSSAFASVGIYESYGLTVNSSTGQVYVGNADDEAETADVLIFSHSSGACAPTVTSSGTGTATTATTATLSGELNPAGCQTTYYFAYGTSSSYGASAPNPAATAAAGTSSELVSAELGGLVPNTEYHFQLVAEADFGSVRVTGEEETFTTPHEAPLVVTGQPSEVQPGSAAFNGTVNPENTQTTYHFQYGTSTSYGSEAPLPEASAGAGIVAEAVGTAVSGLRQATTYHYRLVATNSFGQTMYGEDETFDAATISLATELAGPVSEATATVVGTLNPGGTVTTYEFQYGTSAAYGSSTAPQGAGSGTSVEREAANLTGLTPGTVYHYRLVATDSAGTAYGADQTFSTYATAMSINPPVSSAGGGVLTVPASPALIPTPTLTLTKEVSTGTATKPKSSTKARKLVKALKVCKMESKRKRVACEKQARKRYGTKKKTRKKTTKTDRRTK